MTISQEDARRAIELLNYVADRAALLAPVPADLDEQVLEFLYDTDTGESRFEERDDDPSPDCRCEECPNGGPYTCISED